MPEPFVGFAVGREYRLHEEMWPASPGFGRYIGGIQAKGRYPKTDGIVVLAEIEGGRYGNRWDGELLVYQGEDDKWASDPRNVNQALDKGNNRALASQRGGWPPVYLFSKAAGRANWRYEGLARVERVNVARRAARDVVEFRILPLGIASIQDLSVMEDQIQVLDRQGPPRLTDESPSIAAGLRKARSASFPDRVKRNYEDRCAVCGSHRLDAWGNVEVQAAHIFPREYNGADNARNGLALCTFHHWAFDGGLFFLTREFTIKPTSPGMAVPEIRDLDSKRLAFLPSDPRDRPHEVFIAARGRIPRFADLLRNNRTG
ncbi:MAG TPA: HNH endonuclease [Thermoplasmata archaeon]|nr:HNH endonuclease [Thermoplasmata archaeon]